MPGTNNEGLRYHYLYLDSKAVYNLNSINSYNPRKKTKYFYIRFKGNFRLTSSPSII